MSRKNKGGVCKVIAHYLSESRITRRTRKGKGMEEWKREWVEGWKNVLQSVRIAEGTENTEGVERSTIKDECATEVSRWMG